MAFGKSLLVIFILAAVAQATFHNFDPDNPGTEGIRIDQIFSVSVAKQVPLDNKDASLGIKGPDCLKKMVAMQKKVNFHISLIGGGVYEYSITAKDDPKTVYSSSKTKLFTEFVFCNLVTDAEKKLGADSADLCKPTDASKAYTKSLIDVAEKTRKQQKGGLLDNSRFLSDGTSAELTKLTMTEIRLTTKPDRGTTRVSFGITNNDGYKFQYSLQDNTGDGSDATSNWLVSEGPFYLDQYPNGKSFDKTTLTFWQKGSNPLAHFDIPAKEAFVDGKPNKDALRKYILRAMADAKSEKDDAAKVAKFDLPKEPIGYIGVVEAEADVVTKALNEDIRHFPAMMNERGYKFVAANGKCGEPTKIGGTSDPVEVIREQLTALKKKGIKNAYLNLGAHGNEDGIGFCTAMTNGRCTKHTMFTPHDLQKILSDKEFFDMKIFINSPACHGGGMSKALEKFNDPAGKDGRITLFLHSKHYGVNEEGRLKEVDGEAGQPKAFSTYFDVFLQYYLQKEKLPYGQAFRKADEEVKKYIRVNPEVWVSSKNGGVSTKGVSGNN